MRAMKDSGVEWIGEIPVDWEIRKFKNVSQLFTGNSIKDEEKASFEDSGNARPYLATKDIDAIFSTAIYDNGLYVKNDDARFKVAPAQSTLMCVEGGSAGRKKTIVSQDVCFGNKLCCFNSKCIDNRYLYHFISSPNYESEFKNNISGLIGGVSVSILKNIQVITPPQDCQHSIAAYLDDKCGKIDAIIAHEKAVIEKLKEYKLSVITEAVTKGLNPAAPMKDSGYEFIGCVPANWNVVKLGSLFTFLGGYAFNSDLYTAESNNQVLRIGNVKNDQLLLESNPVYVSDETVQQTTKFKLKPGSILFTMTGTKGKQDYFFTHLLTKNDFSGKDLFLNQRVGCLFPNYGICAGYYNYLLKDRKILDSVFLYETGTANQGNLGIDSIRRTKLHYPPYDEQCRIYEYLSNKCSGIDSAITQKQAVIEKLTGYKKSLIYEVVTGKKEV